MATHLPRRCNLIGQATGPLLIAASASVFPEHREKALAHRFDHFISKPIDINALLILLGEELNVAYLDEEIGEERPETVSIMKYPSQTTLIELLESAQIGDIIKLREATSELKEQTDYVPFAEKMNRFLLSYQMQSLVDWLKELLESTRTVSSKS